MNNFQFYTPTKVFFGKDEHLKVGEIISGYGFKKILLHYGKESIKNSGLYDLIIDSLNKAEVEVVELGGVEPNPKLSLVKKGIEICKNEDVGMVLAVGGGSVIDSAKVIADGAKYAGDPWDFSAKISTPTDALPVGIILTLSASGSEMSSSAVITNEDGLLKRGFNSDYNRPLFSICNPELTFSVNKFQTGCGIVDIMMHTLERYFSKSDPFDVTDRIAESILVATKDAGGIVIDDPENYEARATLMWSGSLSHNDLTHAGREMTLTCHQLEHELSGMYDFVAHGAGLSVIFPAWAKYTYKSNLSRFVQYAKRVWDIGVVDNNLDEAALAGIMATEKLWESIGMPTKLSQLNVGDGKIEEMAEKCTFNGKRILPGYTDLGKQEITDIFKLAL
jgi:alcohol dehydrogenase YqhD (iron-dependent ADH family)